MRVAALAGAGSACWPALLVVVLLLLAERCLLAGGGRWVGGCVAAGTAVGDEPLTLWEGPC